MTKRKQDDISRQNRLNKGQCPTHGTGLEQVDVVINRYGEPVGTLEGCPRRDCAFQREVMARTAPGRSDAS